MAERLDNLLEAVGADEIARPHADEFLGRVAGDAVDRSTRIEDDPGLIDPHDEGPKTVEQLSIVHDE